ncbi:MAG: hypothetical protein L6Q54_14350 [Leptospiraceae bacterium]|nr:hypothetical protein [Leptospiraceae bacterium]MCK6382415.1 hypothetical protein [Leptospiraceae bacterium]
MEKLEIEKIIFHSIMQELSHTAGELSILEVKEMIFQSLQRMSDFTVEWAETKKFGRNKLFLGKGNTALLLDMSEIITGIQTAWKEYQDSLST